MVKVRVQEDSVRLPDFVQIFGKEFAEEGMQFERVEPSKDFDYSIIIVQESSYQGGAAAAVIALDKNCVFATSVVRSGRMTAKGSLNATAKELAKMIAILRGIKQALSHRSGLGSRLL